MPDRKNVIRIGLAVLGICLIVRGWDTLIIIAGAILTAAAPLLVGAAIAYVVNILMSFLERHLLPNSSSPTVKAIRPPLCMMTSFVLILAFIIMTISLLIPALIESFTALGEEFTRAIAWLKDFQPAHPIIAGINSLTSGDILNDLANAKIPDFLKQGLSDIMGPVTSQLTMVVTSVTTFFFGLLFSTWLLLDKHQVSIQTKRALACYLGKERYGKLTHICRVLDHSYHGYIVRQFVEAAMLGIISVFILLILGFPYALGISALVMFAALIPVVGIPTGVCVSAFLVITDSLPDGIIFLVAMFSAQAIIETFVMPHVGDARILMSPVWVMVAVTLGGGLFGFVGMISVTPLAASIYQLLREDVRQREYHTLPAKGENVTR